MTTVAQKSWKWSEGEIESKREREAVFEVAAHITLEREIWRLDGPCLYGTALTDDLFLFRSYFIFFGVCGRPRDIWTPSCFYPL